MRRWSPWLCTLALLAALPVPCAAQLFTGEGARATELFRLEPGLTIFEVEHRGPRAFAVRLLDEEGVLVEQVATGSGRFGGSKAVRVERPGRYLLDVAATGPWSVRLRGADPAVAEASPALVAGSGAGRAAARAAAGTGWLVRGFAGGALAGPIGAAVAANLAGRSRADAPLALPAGAPEDPLYRRGFQQGFEEQLRAERRKRALIGGMVGTGVFLFVLIQLADINDSGDGSVAGGGRGTDPGLSLQPR